MATLARLRSAPGHLRSTLIAAICQSGWMLAEADIVRDRRATSVSIIRTHLINAASKWEDSEVVVDRNIVTSRYAKRPACFRRCDCRCDGGP
jgi:transcriptional regulator GlxA family with amidase domain